MNTVTVTNTWIGTGQRHDPFRPSVVHDHPPQSWVDQSGVSKSPRFGDACAVVCVLSDAKLAALQLDPKYQGKVTVKTVPATQG